MTERASMLCYVPPGRVATDAEPGLERLLREAPARLTLISVVPRAPEWITSRLPGGAQLEALAVEHQRQVLQRLSDGLAREELDCRRLVLVGDPVEVLLAALEDGGHDQLVLDEPTAAEGGLGRELLRRSPVPVRVLGPDGPRHGRVVVAVDPRLEADHQRRLIRLARERARRDGAQLSIVHTWEVLAGHLLASRQSREAHQALLDARRSAHRWALARLVDSIPGALPDERLELLEGHHGPALEADLQRRPADLLVLGSAGRRGVLGWLRGNTAERLLGTARTELLVVPGVDDAITPLPLPATPARRAAG